MRSFFANAGLSGVHSRGVLAVLFGTLTLTVGGGASFAADEESKPGSQGASTASPPPVYVETPGDREFSGEMIVRPIQLEQWQKQGLGPGDAAQRAADARLAASAYVVIEYVPQTDEYIIRVPSGKTENQVSAELMATGLFQYAEPNWILYPIACPNDPLLANQWHHNANRMQSCDGWGIHTGDPSVGVGICDTGVLTTHQDLLLHRREGYNAVDRLWESNGGNISPVHPHGTQTTGCAAANGNNGVGVSGVGWNLSHRMMRVSNSSGGSSSQATLQHAARTSIEAGDKVASVSYSGVDSSSNLTTATYIKSIGGLLVWAAGNDNRNISLSERDADDIIVAAATDQNDNKASFSNYGRMVDVAAPGVSVYTTTSTGGYAAVSGTSFACPLTAGLVALIWSQNPGFTPDQVEDVLKQSSEDLGTAGVDDIYGHGRINVFNAMNQSPPDPRPRIVSQPQSLTVTEGEAASFTVVAEGEPPLSYQWRKDGGNISGATSATYSIAAAQESDEGSYDVVVSNGFGSVTSDPATLTVEPAPIGADIWMSFKGTTTVPGVGSVADEDVVSLNTGSGQWSLMFDGSDVGLSGFQIDGMAVLPSGDILFSFSAAGSVAGLQGGPSGTSVDDSDIVRFVPTSLGANTAGSFFFYFDGSDVGLTGDTEDVDAITLADDGRLILSTSGSFSATGASGSDEDLLLFSHTSLGAGTAGSFSIYFDGSDVELSQSSSEDVDAACWTPDGTLLLSTVGNFSVTGASGANEDVFEFDPASLGGNTSGTYGMFLDLTSLGISSGADVGSVERVP